MAGIEFEVRGLSQLYEQMRSLAPKVARREVTRAMRIAARPMLQAARANAPVAAFSTTQRRAGTVKRNIRLRTLPARGGRLDPGVSIGVRARRGRVVSRARALTRAATRSRFGVSLGKHFDDPFYWYFLEHGWTTRRGGFLRKQFLFPAFAQHHRSFLNTFRDSLGSRIQILWRSGGR